jgi:peptidoglycan L-alanyl-D-glutamate endopeptidase CwlK
MSNYSRISLERLGTCHWILQKVFAEVLKDFDNTIICGTRSKAEQTAALKSGASKAAFGESPHNYTPSLAVDAGPYNAAIRNIDWNDRERITLFAGHVLQTANMMHRAGNIPHTVIWGGDWDDDSHVSDNSFDDLVHFEIANWRRLRTLEAKLNGK